MTGRENRGRRGRTGVLVLSGIMAALLDSPLSHAGQITFQPAAPPGNALCVSPCIPTSAGFLSMVSSYPSWQSYLFQGFSPLPSRYPQPLGISRNLPARPNLPAVSSSSGCVSGVSSTVVKSKSRRYGRSAWRRSVSTATPCVHLPESQQNSTGGELDNFVPGTGFAPNSGIEDFNLAFGEGGGNPPSNPGNSECKGSHDEPGCDDPQGEGQGPNPPGPPFQFPTRFDDPPGPGNPPFIPQLQLVQDTTLVPTADEGRVPVPGTLLLLATGLLSLCRRRLRR